MTENLIEQRVLANAIRFLSIDSIDKAKSGHPGMPMGFADVATVLFLKHLKFDPKNPLWPDRDRFVLSAGHGSMLLYSILYLTGYKDVTLDQLKSFRQLGSITPGHPEYSLTPGVETTTGPLGQGLSNAIGMAISEQILSSKLGNKIIDHYTFAVVGDGCLMEGISHEASSLAGHLKLSKLIVFFDNNNISIDGSVDLTNSEDTLKRYESLGWQTIEIDGHDPKEIDSAIIEAKNDNRPSLISCKTIIGYGSPNMQNTSGVHGSPLGEKETELARKELNWPNSPFIIPDEILKVWRSRGKEGSQAFSKWKEKYDNLSLASQKFLDKEIDFELPDLNERINEYKEKSSSNKLSVASRKASQEILEILVPAIPNLIGGSADLTGSNNTKISSMKAITKDSFEGNYLHYGVREHAMAGIMNGIALHGNLIPYGGTFLVFSDYLRPSLRLSCLMRKRVIYVLTHDSIGLGEDGPTHQPVEHLAALRAIPNLLVFRPADATETAECWAIALSKKNNPSVIALTRQNLESLRNTFTKDNLSSKGGYVLSKARGKTKISLMASGSEVNLALKAKEILEKENIYSSVISMPCHELFDEQAEDYKKNVIDSQTIKIAIEAGTRMSWDKYLNNDDEFVGLNTFGESAPYTELYNHFQINVDKILSVAREKNKI